MDDTDKTSPDAAEYKFGESEVIPEATVDQPSTMVAGPVEETSVLAKFNLKNLNWRRLAVPGAVILAILLIYGISSFFSAKKARSAEQKKVAAQEEEVVAQQSLIPPVKVISRLETEASPSLNDNQMTQIRSQLDDAAQKMLSNRNQILSLSDTVSKVQQDTSNINQSISQLAETMQQALAEIQKIKTLAPAPKFKQKKKISKPLVIYHIRAIVPGRVWLESVDGKNVTLRIGDILEGYGTVEVIAPRQGMILMSNGSIIQYGINDF